MHPSSPADATNLLQGENATPYTVAPSSWPSNIAVHLPDSVEKILTVPSSLPDAINLPSGLKSTHQTESRCPSRDVYVWSATFHSLKFLESPAEHRCLESGDQHIAWTMVDSGENVTFQVSTSHITTRCPQLPAAIHRPLGEKAMDSATWLPSENSPKHR
jgi:hypothetical protein